MRRALGLVYKSCYKQLSGFWCELILGLIDRVILTDFDCNDLIDFLEMPWLCDFLIGHLEAF